MARLSRATTVGRRQASRGADAVSKLPVNSVLPAITGTKTQGQTLTCSSGTWTKSPTYNYQWLRNNVPITGCEDARRGSRAGDRDVVAEPLVVVGRRLGPGATNSGVPATATSAQTTAIVAA